METNPGQRRWGSRLVMFLLGVGVGLLLPYTLNAGTEWFRQTVAQACWNALVTFDRVKTQQQAQYLSQ